MSLQGLKLLYPAYSALKLVVDLLALGWFGFWMAMTLRQPSYASGISLLFVIILPTFIIWVPGALTDIVFLLVARANFLYRFREMAAEPPMMPRHTETRA